LRPVKGIPRIPYTPPPLLTPINMKRMKASLPGGSWRDWPKDLLAPCHVREGGKGYTPVYGRMSWDAPSPTITTQFYNYGSGRFGHPEQDRALSLREGALLQSFPPEWEFVPPGTPVQTTATGRAIGNAVPPALAKSIGLCLMRAAGQPSEAGLAA
jgi:DNA (cytosine-5)-methyltransferase 1